MAALFLAATFCFLVPGVDARAEPAKWLLDAGDNALLDLPETDASLPSPAEHLGYSLGQRFTRHEEILGYLRLLDDRSDRVKLWEYGRSYEDRPLVLLAVSSASNIRRLEELRLRQLHIGAPASDSVSEPDTRVEDPPICIWLAYGIHGNEASSAETAMASAFLLASAGGDWEKRLENVIVLIDPLVNPDGRERYVHWFQQTRGRDPDPTLDAAEHREPWPGGRQNHYLIDLNRDWTWITQRETQARLAEYRRWEPHLYIDFHEMSADSTYFFPPSTEPIHPQIESSTVRWLEVFGSENAAAFDRLGWTYYVAEKFDLFYPGYSDSYPSLRGAVGMTYEMAGHGSAGLLIERADGSHLTLSDRIARHLTTTLTSVRTASDHRTDILSDFVAARRRAMDRTGQTYLWRPDQAEAEATARLLDKHGLSVLRLSNDLAVEARPLDGEGIRRERFPAGTLVLQTAQALGALAEALMEPDTAMPEEFLAEQRRRVELNRSPEFYDITAWSVPLAFNLEVFVAEGRVEAAPRAAVETGRLVGEGRLGYLVRPQGLSGYQFASRLLAEDIRMRLSLAEFEQDGRAFPRGTLFVPARGNGAGIEQRLSDFARDLGLEIVRARTGLSDSGVSLGSDEIVPIRRPRIGLLGGPGVRATSFGFLWFLLDRQLALPYARLDLGSIVDIDLKAFDTLVLPDATDLAVTLDQDSADRLAAWIENGGTLLAIGESVSWLREHDLVDIEQREDEPEDDTDNGSTYAAPLRQSLYTPGAAISGVAHPSHALTVGIEDSFRTLYRGTTALIPSGDPRRDVIVADAERPVVAGFAWPEAEERLRGALLVGLERKGGGAIVAFAQDPFFRLFWRDSVTPFLNALLYAPSLGDRERLVE